jgi:hypothetical protein
VITGHTDVLAILGDPLEQARAFLAAAAARGCTLQPGLPMRACQIDQMIAFILEPCAGRSSD